MASTTTPRTSYGCVSGWSRAGLWAELTDDAAAFDPLRQAPAPDLEASVAARPIGGLGVHLVRRLIDRADYRREAGRNVLRVGKRVTA